MVGTTIKSVYQKVSIKIEFGILETAQTEGDRRDGRSRNSSGQHEAGGFIRPKLSDFLQPPTPNRTWLAFEVLPGPFPQAWAAAFAQEFSRKSLWHFNFGALFVDEPYYRRKIAARITTLARSPDFRTKESEVAPFIKRGILENILFDCAAIHKSLQGKGSQAKVAAELSNLVRHYIQIYHPEYHFHISLQAYVPQTYRLPEDAYQLFTCDRHDGWLYLDYTGDGQDSLSAYNEKATTDHQAPLLFSANSQILYRDNFEGKELQASASAWLKSQNQPSDRVGLIPLAKPLHGLSRNEVRDLFAKSDTILQIRVARDGKSETLESLCHNLSQVHSQSVPHFTGGSLHAMTLWFLRKTSLDSPVNFLIDCHHRYGGLWMIKRPYYWIKPKAFRVYFTVSWPIRVMIYYFQYQISVGFIDYRTLAKVYTGRLVAAIALPFHWMRPYAFRFYFSTSRPVRKTFYFLKFQFEKRVLREKK